MKNLILLFVLILAIAAISNCDMLPTNSKPYTDNSPFVNEEAELAALWLSGDLKAPHYLYRDIKRDLNIIRNVWREKIPETEIKFRPIWAPSTLGLKFDDTTFESIKAGEYHGWDELNQNYGLKNIRIEPTFVILSFHGRLNSMVLYEAYSDLPGFDFGGTIGDWMDMPRLFIYDANRNLKYFFRDAWGDCSATCRFESFNYFEVVDGFTFHRGAWYPYYQSDYDDPPAWYDTLIMARDNFYYYK